MIFNILYSLEIIHLIFQGEIWTVLFGIPYKMFRLIKSTHKIIQTTKNINSYCLLTVFSNEHWSIIVPIFHICNRFLHALWINIKPTKWSLQHDIKMVKLKGKCDITIISMKELTGSPIDTPFFSPVFMYEPSVLEIPNFESHLECMQS